MGWRLWSERSWNIYKEIWIYEFVQLFNTGLWKYLKYSTYLDSQNISVSCSRFSWVMSAVKTKNLKRLRSKILIEFCVKLAEKTGERVVSYTCFM